MLKEDKKYYCGVFFLLFIGYLSVLIVSIFEWMADKPCYNPVILDRNEFKNEIPWENIPKLNESHISICLQHHEVPVVRKCCEKEKILNITKGLACVDGEDGQFETSLATHFMEKNSLLEFNSSNFYRQYGSISCPNGKYLSLETDFTLQSDGKMKLTGVNDTHLTAEIFCLDVIRQNQTLDFGAIVCFPEQPKQGIELIIYAVGGIISTPFLFAIFICYVIFQDLRRKLHGLFVMCHAISLFIFYIFLAISQLKGASLEDTFCKICGFIIQYSFHATFFWLNLMCADMWLSFRYLLQRRNQTVSRRSLRNKFIYCCGYAWGCPAIISCISLIMDLQPDIPDHIPRPEIGGNMCLINAKSNPLGALVYLYGPMTILLISNFYFFISTVFNIRLHKKQNAGVFNQQENRRSKEEDKRFTMYLKLFIIMGVFWLMEPLSWVIGGKPYWWFVPDFANSLNGIYIFMVFLPEIKKPLMKKIHRDESQQKSDTTKSSSTRSRLNSGLSIYSKKNEELFKPPIFNISENDDKINSSGNLPSDSEFIKLVKMDELEDWDLE